MTVSHLTPKQWAILEELDRYADKGLSAYRCDLRGWPWQSLKALERRGLVQPGEGHRVEEWFVVPGAKFATSSFAHHRLIRITPAGSAVYRQCLEDRRCRA